MHTISEYWQKYLFTLITGLSLFYTLPVQSQIIPDNTLGSENSKFTPGEVKDLIEGGAIRGNNLFHSFSEFNINNNQQVYFTNPTGINNILTRVTGNNISNIFGTLGVNGNANLFLINPNGIIFGQNAKLDIKGSFLASTANAIKFGDNNLFSAKDTNTTPLLTMSAPVGVQWGNNPTGDITNNGNLTTGKDLTLSGRNLNIIASTLQTGGNLTLESQQKVKIEDSINKPVILKSSGNITIQGNQSVEINALNNNLSNFTSDKDIIFRSPVRLLSNGKYTVGGYFSTEDLNQNVIDFIIPHNNVIKVNGDITLQDYTGSSLYILASGKVTLNRVNIIDVDNKPITQIIPDGQGANQTVIINSKNDVRILDVRAGININKLTHILENNPSLPSGITATFNNVSSGDIITVDNGKYYEDSYPFFLIEAKIKNNGGNVFLTNEYKFNSELLSANIIVGTINTSTSNKKDGGAIALSTHNGNIMAQNLYSFSVSFETDTGNGGAIALSTHNGNIMAQNLYSSSVSLVGNSATGGAIALSTNNGNISTQNLNTSSYLATGGAIALSTNNGNISTQNLNTSSFLGTGGYMSLSTNNGNISTQNLDTFSYSGTGGAIALSTNYGNMTIQNLNTYSNLGTGGAMALTGGGNISVNEISTYGDHGNGGAVYINAAGNITGNKIGTYTKNGSNTNGGEIKLFAGNSVLINGGVGFSYKDEFALSSGADDVINGNGGNIIVSAKKDIIINPTNMGLTSAAVNASAIYRLNENIGNSGNIQLTSLEGNIIINGGIFTNTTTAFGLSSGNSGDIKLNAINGMINVRANGAGAMVTRARTDIHTDDSHTGKAGNIEINAHEINIIGSLTSLITDLDITTQSSETGTGGDIIFNSKNPLNLVNLTIGTDARNGSGGTVKINAPGVTLDHTYINTTTVGTGKAGDIEIVANNYSVLLKNNSTIKASSQINALGDGGTIIINSKDFILQNNSIVQATTDGSAKGGNIFVNSHINSANSVILTDKSSLSVAATNNNTAGQSGIINLNTKSLTLTGNSSTETAKILASTTKGEGLGIILNNLDTLNLINGEISASTNTGNAGSINLNVNSDSAESVNMTGANSSMSVRANDRGGNAGSINLNTRQLIMTNNAEISASNISGTSQDINLENLNILDVNYSKINATTKDGTAGNLKINAANSVKISNNSELSTATFGSGNAGSIDIITNNFQILENAQISATSLGSGKGGNIKVSATNFSGFSGGKLITNTSGSGDAGDIKINTTEIVSLDGKNTGLFANTLSGSSGESGSIDIDPTQVILTNGAAIAVDSQGTGNGGNLHIQSGMIKLDNNSLLSAATKYGEGGNIILNIDNYLLMRNNSLISAKADNTANGGNIEIKAPFLIAINTENSDIIANAVKGKGGIISITTEGIFGLKFFPTLTLQSDINASSEFGVNGTIEINTPGIDPTTGLTQLPSTPIDLSKLINKSCQVTTRHSFKFAGKNGIPLSPYNQLTPNQIFSDWGNSANIPQKSPLISENTLQKEILNQQEAQGFIKDDKDNIILTLRPLQVTINGVYLHPLDCARLLSNQ